MNLSQILYALFHIDQSLITLVHQYGTAFYLILFVMIFCETGFVPLFFLPGDPLLFICGAFSATGALNLWMLMPTLFFATFGGCTVNYWIGRAIGKQVFTRDYRWLNRAALTRSHLFCEKYGGTTLLISPYLAVIRTFAPFIAGISEMNFSRFQLFNFLGALLWVAGLVVSGYLFGNIAVIRNHLSAIVLTGVAIGLGALILGTVLKFFNRSAGQVSKRS